MTTRALLTVSVLSLSLLAGGCASTNGLSTQASLGDPNALAAQKSLAGTPVASVSWPRSDWWTALGDAELDRLMEEALAGSPTLKVAAARTRKALAFAQTSKARWCSRNRRPPGTAKVRSLLIRRESSCQAPSR